MFKGQLKISGGRRTQHGAQAWLRVRGHISTARKNGLRIITALRDAITGNPWLPTTIDMGLNSYPRSSDELVFESR